MQFETQKAKLENQLEFERSKAKSTEERIHKMESIMVSDRESIAQLEQERTAREAEKATLANEIEEASEQLDSVKQLMEEKGTAVSKVKKQIQKLQKEVEGSSKSMAAKESEIEKLSADKFSIFRKCKLEEIKLPFLEGSLDDLSLDQLEIGGADSMEIDSQTLSFSARVQGFQVDFSNLKPAHKQNGSDEMEVEFQETLRNLTTEIERMAPNMRAVDRLDEVEHKLKETAREFDAARREAKSAKDAFMKIKQERYDRFYRAYTHIAEKIDPIYKELTKSKTFPMGGTAYLSLEDSEEPYNDGVKYHAMPPMKRFRDMELLSGGEKTVAALALLFAIHSYQPAPFFVLDEVDAALDNANVAKVANYIRRVASNSFQFIVISLKHTFYERAEALVGVYRDQGINSSKVLTLNLERFLD
ncbi:uncharacterized protein SPPG_06900 [Spizellomyces punctatus DAOM BR117]|uniref:RecF/RecN/SMC N-terminal domain-containing protein n=1 Tax=Spizellomyces punctatus (strain DAOM BR117) TaxID=645134 RepID=A0A0L0HAH6_SPIPD|nr:uncharacterized protein SPPG_06900 [Spizellomyces punctatus DAOM BR117]KNC97909.1 hypothetical protein SPPG_06900 [Spizellomyces punctatus DAOM BR117]|eukprot:XP_016605949.1 hypothetical protein SPPG_06900 [Spizellomyces punctatus DAOM BR117]